MSFMEAVKLINKKFHEKRNITLKLNHTTAHDLSRLIAGKLDKMMIETESGEMVEIHWDK